MLEDIISVEINHCARLPEPRSVTISRLIDEEALQTQIWVRSQHLSDPKLSKYWWKLNQRYCSRGSGGANYISPTEEQASRRLSGKLNSFVWRVRLLYGGRGMIFYCGKRVSRNLPSPPARPHLGQHSPAGANRLCPAGQLRGGQGQGPQATLPLEQMHSVQGEGLHWLSCCRDGRWRKDEEEEEKFAKPRWQKSSLQIYKSRRRKKKPIFVLLLWNASCRECRWTQTGSLICGGLIGQMESIRPPVSVHMSSLSEYGWEISVTRGDGDGGMQLVHTPRHRAVNLHQCLRTPAWNAPSVRGFMVNRAIYKYIWMFWVFQPAGKCFQEVKKRFLSHYYCKTVGCLTSLSSVIAAFVDSDVWNVLNEALDRNFQDKPFKSRRSQHFCWAINFGALVKEQRAVMFSLTPKMAPSYRQESWDTEMHSGQHLLGGILKRSPFRQNTRVNTRTHART